MGLAVAGSASTRFASVARDVGTPASRQASKCPWGEPASRQASKCPWGEPASRQASKCPWGEPASRQASTVSPSLVTRTVDRILVGVYVALAALPVLAMVLHFRDHKINGALPKAPLPKLSFGAFTHERYQPDFVAWFESRLGGK